MLCRNCEEYNIMQFIDYYSLNQFDSSEINNLASKYLYVCTGLAPCLSCGNLILPNQSIINEEEALVNSVKEIWGSSVQKLIKYCSECGDGQHIQSMKGSIDSIFNDEDDNPEEIFDSIDTSSELRHLIINELGDPFYQLVDDIAKNIQCPKCKNGSGINMDDKEDYGIFDEYTHVYTQADINEFNHTFYGDRLIEAEHEIVEIAKQFSFNEIVVLKDKYIEGNLSKESHALEKLEKIIINILRNKSRIKPFILPKSRLIYRTRTNKIGELYSKDKMWNPPKGIASVGRYNSKGESILYCANNTEILKKEISCENDKQHNIACFLTLEPLVLFPINKVFDREFNGLVSENANEFHESNKIKEQYVISNIVSNIVAKVGFKGIAYKSTKDNFSTNFALFNFEQDKELTIVNCFLESDECI